MNTEINFVRGLHGLGVVIEVTYNKSRAIFDFGAPFVPLSEVYDGTVLHRNKNRVKDAILLNKAPEIDYVYHKKDLFDLPLLPSEESPYETAIFISHCHLDHMSEIDKVDENIKVYLHKDSYNLKKVLEEIHEDDYYRNYSYFEYEDEIMVNEIKVTPYFSDHTYGASSFLIETPDSRIIYSGDIRFHALEYQKAYDVIEKYNKDIDLLIVDSTIVSPIESVLSEELIKKYKEPSKDLLEGMISEQDIYDDTSRKLDDYDGLAIFNLYHRDIKMLDKMIGIADIHNRLAVFEPDSAYIINKLLNKKVNVLFPDNYLNYDYYDYVKENNNIISKEDIIINPNKYFIQNSYANILELTDYDGLKGKYFHLFGEPLTPKQKHHMVMMNIINKLNFEYSSYLNLYSFSHAYPNNIAYYVKEVNAKAVVAVHSSKPENLNPVNSIQYFPMENKKYLLINGELIEK